MNKQEQQKAPSSETKPKGAPEGVGAEGDGGRPKTDDDQTKWPGGGKKGENEQPGT